MASPAVIGKSKLNEDVEITQEDQKMINDFANKNSKHNEIKALILSNKKQLQNYEDAGDEIMLNDDESVSVYIGETFFKMSKDEAQAFIDEGKESIEKELKILAKKAEAHTMELKDLKIKLYAKFGTNINLEEEEDS
ncbi:prefoldin subunit 4 isoform X2 [Hydra vulgaris]|uniref:Prefoldin subunit 4 n=1 Tax=Hydra vulgaris TaxID=6087 RepID=A0ABM4DKB6_HYDVU